MAANKFAALLHRNTNKITLILIYAVLEWVLIVLLLLNSLFSYLIIKFAEFFGLKPPCLWCTRLDHVFDPSMKDRNIHRDILCEAHAKEISKMGYCSNHRKLVESLDMCEDCLSSSPEFDGVSKKITFLKEKVGENGKVSSKCSCCGLSLENINDDNIYSSYLLLKTSSWDVLELPPEENLIKEAGNIDDTVISDKKISDFSGSEFFDGGNILEDKNSGQMLSENVDGNLEIIEKEREEIGFVSVIENQLKETEDGKIEMVVEVKDQIFKDENLTLRMEDKSVQVCVEEDAPVVNSAQHLEFFLDFSGQRLVPIELVDLEPGECNSKDNVVVKEEYDGLTTINEDFSLGFEIAMEGKEDFVVENGSRFEEEGPLLDIGINEEPKFDSLEVEEDETSLTFHPKINQLAEEFEQFKVFHSGIESAAPNDVEKLIDAAGKEHSACEEASENAHNENEADVSIGTEIPDLDIADDLQNQEYVCAYGSIHQEPLTSSTKTYETSNYEIEEQMVELQPLSLHDSEHTMNDAQLNDIEEDKVLDTPTSVDSLNQLHKKLLLLEKRDSGTEESFDGSVTSELETGDGVVTVEHLKSVLRSEQKALQALYAELEEERSASAIAASQTMAMINRLQEEKAAMQMEALQYQRMMEEQSEYDQEALQLLNELMIKREKEKHELEKEMEIYRKKLLEYETREKIRVLRKSKDGSARSGLSSGSCSNAEDSDGLSIDLNQETREEEGSYGHQENSRHNTPVDVVVNLEESLADFEEERLSILEQLKVLEEKLMTMDDGEEQHFEDVRPMEDFLQGNGTHETVHMNGEANGFSNGNCHQMRRIAVQEGKSLLPLFDATSDENGDTAIHGDSDGNDSNGVNGPYGSKFETESNKPALEEEVDHLFERLQALEADREFLKHCISSLNKGDKGMDLLQEILQHLRDLRNVELRARSLSDNAMI